MPKRFSVRQEWFKRGDSGQIFAVMCEGGGLPTVLHETFGKAAFEAARLASANPGFRFHILASYRVAIADPEPAAAEELAA